jgi:hypothetical protein
MPHVRNPAPEARDYLRDILLFIFYRLFPGQLPAGLPQVSW